jgi:hypothetical protein
MISSEKKDKDYFLSRHVVHINIFLLFFSVFEQKILPFIIIFFIKDLLNYPIMMNKQKNIRKIYYIY